MVGLVHEYYRTLVFYKHLRKFEQTITKTDKVMIQVYQIRLHITHYSVRTKRFKAYTINMPLIMSEALTKEVLQASKSLISQRNKMTDDTIMLTMYTVETMFLEYDPKSVVSNEIEASLMEEHSYMFDIDKVTKYTLNLLVESAPKLFER